MPGLSSVRRDLTVKVWEPGEQIPTTVKAYRQNADWIYLPRKFGIDLCGTLNIPVKDRTSEGEPLRKLRKIKPWVAQVTAIEKMVLAAAYEYDVQLKSATASGKTIMALEVARRLGRTLLVVVDTNFLADQWMERIEKHFGISGDKVGRIQGKTIDVAENFITIGMLQTLYNKPLNADIRRYFGTVVFDECQSTGAPQFNRVLYRFPARVRMGITATPRDGALGKIVKWHMGKIQVETKTKHKPSRVYYFESDTVYSWYANISPKTGRFINEVAGDGMRNLKLVEAILWIHERDRDAIMISDRIEQLESLMALCRYAGISDEDMGLCTAHRHTYKYAKDLQPERKPQDLEKGCEYTPVIMQMVKQRNSKADLVVAKSKKLIFATYAIFAKGVDVPRLSAGLDCTPRSSFVQTHGRILRSGKGKKVPIWITVRDTSSYRAEYQFEKRISELAKSNVEVFRWRHDKGVQRRDVKELRREAGDNCKKLKSRKIVTSRDNNYMLAM